MPQTSPRKPRRPPAAIARLMSQTEAARVLGTSRPTVVAWIAARKLEAEDVGGQLKVVRASVDAMLAARRAEAAAA